MAAPVCPIRLPLALQPSRPPQPPHSGPLPPPPLPIPLLVTTATPQLRPFSFPPSSAPLPVPSLHTSGPAPTSGSFLLGFRFWLPQLPVPSLSLPALLPPLPVLGSLSGRKRRSLFGSLCGSADGGGADGGGGGGGEGPSAPPGTGTRLRTPPGTRDGGEGRAEPPRHPTLHPERVGAIRGREGAVGGGEGRAAGEGGRGAPCLLAFLSDGAYEADGA